MRVAGGVKPPGVEIGTKEGAKGVKHPLGIEIG